MQIFKVDATTFGIIEDARVSFYHNHAGSGEGCNNLVIDHPTLGELDLEFTHSAPISEVEEGE